MDISTYTWSRVPLQLERDDATNLGSDHRYACRPFPEEGQMATCELERKRFPFIDSKEKLTGPFLVLNRKTRP